MKKRWMGAVALLLIIYVIYFFGTTMVKGVAAFSQVLSNHELKVHFTNPIKLSSAEEEEITVKNAKGQDIPVSVKLSENRKTITIEPETNDGNWQDGKYELTLPNQISSRLSIPLLGENVFEFNVISSLPTIVSEDELREMLLADLEEETSGSIFSKWEVGITNQEESSTTMDSAGDFSQTNVQVGGIDEGDLVKTDGKYIYSTNSTDVFITDAEDMKLVSTIEMEKGINPQQIFLEDDKLVVISQMYNDAPYRTTELADMNINVNGTVNIKVFDVKNRTKPVEMKEIGIAGNFSTSRLHKDHVYIVANEYPDVWALRDEKESEIIPNYFDSVNGIQSQKLGKIQYVPDANEKNFLHLLAINLDSEQLDYNVETIMGTGDNLYMSSKYLYIAASDYKDDVTNLFKYEIDGLAMTFHSLGEVNGHIINQFAMDEHKGNLRIATTIRTEKEPTNSLYILDKDLDVIGELNGLAKDEQIYSVRYMGDKAYMITFKEVDPLFVIDTSKPTKPVVLGELKIPGYSSYLHFYDEDHLIGFGYDTKVVQGEGGQSFVQTEGMKISLFDVSDFSNPKEADSVIIGGNGTHSEVLYDHKALFQHKNKNLYGFPISIYESSESHQGKFVMNGALIYEITPENGIVLKSTIENDGEREEFLDWEKTIRRLIYIDDNLYTISNKQIKLYDLDDFSYQDAVDLPSRN